MVEVISIDESDGEFEGVAAFKNEYRVFVTDGDEIRYINKYRKSDFNGLEDFAAVIGKFNPYRFFLKQPVPVDSITRKNIEEVWEGVR